MHNSGFSLVEILIVIAVIGILTAIGIVVYNSIQTRAAENSMLSDLEHASSELEQYALDNDGDFPDTAYLTQKLTTSKDVTLVVYPSGQTTGPVYTGLTAVQNGVLFHQICTNLVSQNRPDVQELKYGQGYQMNYLGQRVGSYNYLWGPNTCNIYNHGDIQINGAWSSAGGTFNTPIQQSRISQEANKNRTDQSPTDFPDYNHVVNQFYAALDSQFLAAGGTYPVTTFWDPWANQWSGVPYQALPTITTPVNPSGSDAGGYCVQAYHAKYTSLKYRVTATKLSPEAGTC